MRKSARRGKVNTNKTNAMRRALEENKNIEKKELLKNRKKSKMVGNIKELFKE